MKWSGIRDCERALLGLHPSAFILHPLKGGAQPADLAGAFLGGALGVQRAEVGEDGVVGRGGREGVGAGHGGVEVVVELAEDGDEAVLVDDAFLRGEFQPPTHPPSRSDHFPAEPPAQRALGKAPFLGWRGVFRGRCRGR